jgi:hypothetical protein
MLIADENVSENEIWRLREAGFAVRVIGQDVAVSSVSDENILPVLRRLKKPTFFTRDRDFWKAALCHASYALVYLDIAEHEGEVARCIIKFLHHPSFKTAANRLGSVFRIAPQSIQYWRLRQFHSESWD